MSTRSNGRSVRYAAGAVLVVGGLVAVVWGFGSFAGTTLDGSGSGAGRSMALFAGGGLAAVVGFGLIAFTRAGSLAGRGGYTRMTIEQGYAVPGPAVSGAGSHCRSCGAAVAAEDRYCGSCGTALTPADPTAGPR